MFGLIGDAWGGGGGGAVSEGEKEEGLGRWVYIRLSFPPPSISLSLYNSCADLGGGGLLGFYRNVRVHLVAASCMLRVGVTLYPTCAHNGIV